MADDLRNIDLHLHTTVSDGTDTPQELLKKAKAAGLSLFSATDHDAVKAGRIIRGLLTENDPIFVPGAEFSCRDEEGKYHILGYGFDPDDEDILAVVERGHALRMNKVRARLDYLRDACGCVFPEDEIAHLLSLDNPGKPHLGNLMVKYGYAENKNDAISQVINRAPVKSEYIRPEEAIAGILDAGGIPVLAHPFYGSGDELILGDDMEHRIRKLTGCGLRGIEAFYSGFTEKLRDSALDIAARYDLLVTAGSDYHGTNKMVVLGDTGLPSYTGAYPDGLRRFLEAVTS